MVPFEAAVKPSGAPVTVQTYGGTPPVAAKVVSYGKPAVPFGSVRAVITSAGGVMIKVNSAEALAPVASVTASVITNVPSAVGVPVMVLPLSRNPGGKPVAVKV